MGKVKQHITNAKRFRKDNYKPTLEYINWSELVQDFDLKSGDICYSEVNKLETIINNFINNNR
tara:strand:- start:27 stop:215 length:189 start_codon:yes stop_codon:yes gene_type:complete